MILQSHIAQALLNEVASEETLEPEDIYRVLRDEFIEAVGALAIQKGIYSGEDEWSIILEEVREDDETPLMQEAPEIDVDQKFRFLEMTFRYTDQTHDTLQNLPEHATAQDFIEAIDGVLYQAEQYLTREMSLQPQELEQLAEAVKEGIRKVPEGKEAVEQFGNTLRQEQEEREIARREEKKKGVVDLGTWRKLR